MTLEGKTLGGYTTEFSFTREEVRRGWWEFSKKFGTPLNMKAYYKVKIPSDYTDGNADLMIYSKTDPVEGGVRFFIGVTETEFRDQIKNLLVDFKREFYIKKIIDGIKSIELDCTEIARKYEDTKSEEMLDSLISLRQEIDVMKSKIKAIEKSSL